MRSVTYAECHMKTLYVECHNAECHYAECRGANSNSCWRFIVRMSQKQLKVDVFSKGRSFCSGYFSMLHSKTMHGDN
jgi:hypothetical protein